MKPGSKPRSGRLCPFLFSIALAAPPAALAAQGPTAAERPRKEVTTEQRIAWMPAARWGVMTHYLMDWIARDHKLTPSVEEWNRLVDGFDAEGLAEQVKSTGAGYHIFTIGQNSGYYVSPNATYDKLVGIRPSKCSRRDLIADLSAAFHKRGLKLIAYLPSGAPNGDPVAMQALEWQDGPYPNLKFQAKWEAIIREWSERWGDKIDGWWFDGCFWPNIMYRACQPPNFESFAAAARAGNPMSAVAFNPGVVPRLISLSPYEDYTAGEISNPATLSIRRNAGGTFDGKQIQVLSYLGRTWGSGEPRFTIEQVLEWSQGVRKFGGVITWDVPLQPNGQIVPAALEQLKAIGKAVAGGTPAPATTTPAPAR